MSVADFLPEPLREGRVDVVVGGERTAWADLELRSAAFAAVLSRLGGGRLMLRLDSSVDGIALLLAATSCRASVIFASPHYNEARLREWMEALDADHLVAAVEGSVHVLHQRAVHPTSGSRGAVCLLTSGSTGTPKAVHHTWASLANGTKLRGRFANTSWLLTYPLSHFAGMQVFLQCFVNGGVLVLPRDTTPSEGASAIREEGVQYMSCTPTYARQLFLTCPREVWHSCSLRQVTLGGEIVDQSVLDLVVRCVPGVRVTHIYASSELGPVIEIRDGRAGFDLSLVDGQRIRIVDGELQVRRSKGAMLGYLDASSASEWFSTRDLVEVVGDRVTFIGRSDDIINVGGFKVSPRAVEKVIREVEGVIDVLVVPQRSSLAGNLFKAVIQPALDADRAGLKRAVVDACRRELPDHMTPRLFAFVDELEISPASRKLVRAGGS